MLLLGVVQAQFVVEKDWYQGPVLDRDNSGLARTIQPAWTLDLGDAEQPVIRLIDGYLLVRVKGELQAYALATGKLIWRVPGVSVPLAVGPGRVVVSRHKTLQVLDGKTGTINWSAELIEPPNDVEWRGNTVYVATEHWGLALDARTGEVRWRIEEGELSGLSALHDGVSLWRAWQGEPHHPYVYGVDDATGKRLYRLSWQSGPIGRLGQAVLTHVDDGLIGSDSEVTLQWNDLRTGKEVNQFSLAADFECEGTVSRNSGEVRFAPPYLYVIEKCGKRVAQYPLPKPGQAAAKAPVRRFEFPDGGQYLAGPIRDKLVFSRGTEEVWTVPVEGNSPSSVNGASMPTGAGLQLASEGLTISRIDIIGSRLYLGRVDGSLLVCDLLTGRPYYQLELPWKGFGPTWRGAGYAIFSSPGQLAVVKEPQ